MALLIGKSRACKKFENSLNRYERHRKPKNGDAKIQEAVSFLNRNSSSRFVSRKQLNSLRFKVAALPYRLGKQFPTDEADPEIFTSLLEHARQWRPNKELTAEEIQKLSELAKYPESAKIILENSFMRVNFFKWSFVNNLSVKVFVEFPALTEKLSRSGLKMRLGATGGEEMEIVEAPGKKDVRILVEGKSVSFLKGHRVVPLSHGVMKTIDQICEGYRQKNKVEGDLTFFKGRGVCNWDPHKQSPVSLEGEPLEPLDLDEENWYKKLPMKEHLTNEEATEKFGFPCDGTQYVFTLVATRTADKLNTFGSHSFFRLAIPDGEGGYDYTFGWGKFTKEYPKNFKDLLSILCGPKLAVIEYPDNNEQYTYREKKEIHFPMTMDNGIECVESIRQDLIDAMQDNLAFQILNHNCTDWVADKLTRFVGEAEGKLFEMGFLDLELVGIIGLIVKINRKAPYWFQNIFFYALSAVLGGWRKIRLTQVNGEEKIISIMKDPPWKRRFQHPGMLFRNAQV